MDFSPKRLIKLLQERGWVLDRIKGSHHIFYNEETGETMPIPVHGNKDLKKGLFYAILKKTGIDKNEI
jgi:predicted RNA binding protein YcfA (HicA-like mRNA interferase family)